MGNPSRTICQSLASGWLHSGETISPVSQVSPIRNRIPRTALHGPAGQALLLLQVGKDIQGLRRPSYGESCRTSN